MMTGERTLTVAQVGRLADMVRGHLAELGDTSIRAPSPSDYRAEQHRMLSYCCDLSVDIDIGTTVLTLRCESPWRGMTLGPDTDLRALSEAIRKHVVLARSDHAGLARLEAAEATFRAKIRRDRLPLELISVRFAPGLANRPASTIDRDLWVRVNLLDDMLLPYIGIITGGTTRAICRDLKDRGEDQARRFAALDRLIPCGAALEIDATAEHAIVAAGRDIGEVMHTMLALRKPDFGSGQPVTLCGEYYGEHHVSVVARDGRICLEADLPGIWWTWDHGIIINRAFPADIVADLVGSPLRTLIDHPLLQGDAMIAEAAGWGPYQTKIRLEENERSIGRGELGWGAC